MKPETRHAKPTARTKPLPVAAGIAAALAIVAAIAALVSLSNCTSAAPETEAAAPYVCPYDWAGLARDGDRLTYSENGQLKSQIGVDVSDHQGSIDWQAVAADGIEFAFVRAGSRGYTEGGLIPDTLFAENIDGASAAGLETGAYFFSQAVTVEEAREEAELMLTQLEGRTLSLPIVYDHESVTEAAGRANDLDGETLTACALAFCERIEAAGFATMIYGNANDMARYDRSALGERAVWLAEYDVDVPTAQFDYAMWQYTNAGSVAGISTLVDLNIRFTDAL